MARHTAKSHKIRKVEILVIQILIDLIYCVCLRFSADHKSVQFLFKRYANISYNEELSVSPNTVGSFLFVRLLYHSRSIMSISFLIIIILNIILIQLFYHDILNFIKEV